MRGGSGANPRQAWYDRNPSVVFNAFSGTVAPHAVTQRWLYTVPAGRKSYAEFGEIETMRATAAAPADVQNGQFLYTPSGGAGAVLLIVDAINNTVGTPFLQTVGSSVLMFAGDSVAGRTSDASTGGTVLFRIILKCTEFDA